MYAPSFILFRWAIVFILLHGPHDYLLQETLCLKVLAFTLVDVIDGVYFAGNWPISRACYLRENACSSIIWRRMNWFNCWSLFLNVFIVHQSVEYISHLDRNSSFSLPIAPQINWCNSRNCNLVNKKGGIALWSLFVLFKKLNEINLG